MKRLRRVFAQALSSFLCFTLLLLAVNTSIVARQTASLAGQTTSPRPSADSITLAVTVTDNKGNYIGGLDKNAFTIYDNKAAQETSFFAAQDEPISVGVLVDLSDSMVNLGGVQLKTIGSALLRFARLGKEANEYFLVGFADRPRILIDWTSGGRAFEEKLSKLRTADREGTNTALYDACYLGIEKLKNSTYSKRVLLLISDGVDTESRHSFKEVREALRNSDVMFYSVGLFGGVPVLAGTRNMPILNGVVMPRSADALRADGQSIMSQLSSLSGGVASFPDNKKIGAALDAIAIELRHQYLLGFKLLDDKADGKWHQLKIKVKPPQSAPASMSNLSARARAGYYAVKNLR
jgi:Ca-activated chloride channel family protein